MELTDEQLIDFLGDPAPRIRAAALETLAAGYCEEPAMLRAVFDAWDRYGVAEAFPELPMLGHLPASEELADEALLRASAMSRGRKLVDPVCRCAGKLIEAYSVAPPRAYAGSLHRFESLRRESKIFFRVDVEAMQRRAEFAQKGDAELLAIAEREPGREGVEAGGSSAGGGQRPMQWAIDELHLRGEADAIWRAAIFDLQAAGDHKGLATDACLEVLTRRAVAGFEPQLVSLLDAADAKISDAAAIGLVRCRSATVVDAVSQQFESLGRAGRLRAAAVLQRMRLPGVASRVRLLADLSREDQGVIEALRAAEILQFDFDQVEDWLEAVVTIDDKHLRRIEQRLHLAVPLASRLPEDDQRRFMRLLRSRLAA